MLKTIKMQTSITIRQLLDEIMNNAEINENFCVYLKDSDASLSLDLKCYIDLYPTGDENNEDVFSEFVIKNNLELAYYGEQFIDVINNVRHQKKNAKIEDFVKALNYYSENDTFLDF
jgi:hypothetical protein